MTPLRCPACGEARIDGSLRCDACNAELEFDDAGQLRKRPESLLCPCGTRNALTEEHCRGCGRQVQKTCPRCGFLHPVSRVLCPRHGEPLRRTSPWFRTAAVAMLAMALLGGGVSLLAQAPPKAPVAHGPRIDVVFAIDATGSMADEIDVVKEHVRAMMGRIRSGQPAPRVRFGLVAYRDHGDSFVTRVSPLTDDIGAIEAAVRGLVADGGGDTPEAVADALHAAVHDVEWDQDPATARLLFLVGDAAPHMDAGYDFRTEVALARQKGIKIHALGCSGIDESGEPEFREIASAGGGSFEFLTYRQEVVRQDGSSGYVLYQGTEAYEQSTDDADWRKGADKLAREGAAKALPAGSAAPASPALGKDLENNLDRVLTESVMDEARARGTTY